MSIILVLIPLSILFALAFLGAFIWAVRGGQFEDTTTPPLQQRSLASVFALGLLNGLLPCGLVYVAAAGATASGHFLAGLESMVAFGLGTLPMMLAFGLAGPKLQFALRFKLQRLIPASLAVVGALLVLRGLALGIPYLSPDLSAGMAACPGCHSDGVLEKH